MSPLNVFLNCIILILGPQGIFAVPPSQNAISTESPCLQDVLCGSNTSNVVLHGTACSCNFGANAPPKRDDYQYTSGIGSHKLHTRAVPWNDARRNCIEEGAHLAVVNSMAEGELLQDMLNRSDTIVGSQLIKEEAFLGLYDIYREGEWITVLDEPLAKTGFTIWTDMWNGQPDNDGGNQNCAAFLPDGTLDDIPCERAGPFFCELPEIQLYDETETGS